jgi:large subunit ribosomal protein L23
MRAQPERILKRPVVTERTTAMKEAHNQVVFEVSSQATKPAIKTAIEKAFKVKVLEVNTMVVRGKLKRVGRYVGKRSSWKKAIATLKPGEKIEFFEGV